MSEFLPVIPLGTPTEPFLKTLSREEAEALETQWVGFQRQAVEDGLPLAELSDGRSDVTRVWPGVVDIGTIAASTVDVCVTGCDRNCGFCFESAAFLRSNNQLTLETAGSLLDLFTSTGSHLEEVTYFGGEYFLQDHASEIIVATAARTSAATDEPMRVRAVTNGSEAAQEKVQDAEVARALSRLAVSREAATEELNDRLRGRNASKRFDRMVAIAVGMGIKTDMNVTVMQSNVGELRQLISMAHSLGLSRVNLHGLTTTVGNAKLRARHEQLSSREWRERVIHEVAKITLDLARQDKQIAVDVESMHSDDGPFADRDKAPFSCAVQQRTNIQLVQPIRPGKIWEMVSCNAYFGSGMSSHVVVVEPNGAVIRRRAGRSEGTDTMNCTQGCPARSKDRDSGESPPCIYRRASNRELYTLALRPGI